VHPNEFLGCYVHWQYFSNYTAIMKHIDYLRQPNPSLAWLVCDEKQN